MDERSEMATVNVVIEIRTHLVLQALEGRFAVLDSQAPFPSISFLTPLNIPDCESQPLSPHRDGSETTTGTQGRQHKL